MSKSTLTNEKPICSVSILLASSVSLIDQVSTLYSHSPSDYPMHEGFGAPLKLETKNNKFCGHLLSRLILPKTKITSSCASLSVHQQKSVTVGDFYSLRFFNSDCNRRWGQAKSTLLTHTIIYKRNFYATVDMIVVVQYQH
ncbi:hypothetical protein BDF20DRAFT_835693 [Mycotypha africana]|uniref:uncharacterized protein n=1 Tax=Mycotypha africana TaxID=64632 RepID=UPI002300BCB4|nr:uncharacterized protein BDF20DRAFT_835693 [Mycotypha africana]KAI8979715.1 hypothetical protein BDF20DRAFT_835693 [Mycotypha africana]